MSLKLLTLQKRLQWHAEVWAPPLKISVTANGLVSNVCKIFILAFFCKKVSLATGSNIRPKLDLSTWLSIYFFIQPTEHSKRFLQVSFRKFTFYHWHKLTLQWHIVGNFSILARGSPARGLEEPGIEPLTFRLVDSPLYHLNPSLPKRLCTLWPQTSILTPSDLFLGFLDLNLTIHRSF